jgi:hypothetical protein
MLYDWITGDIIDFVVFDSIGALVTEAELARTVQVSGRRSVQSHHGRD